MSGVTQSKNLCGFIPVFKRVRIPILPYGLEALPSQEALLYDESRIKKEGISLTENTWWYMIPSLECIVFFVYVQHEATPRPDQENILMKRGYSSSGSSIDSFEEDDTLYTLHPCTYQESKRGYEECQNSPRRRQLARWMEDILGEHADFRLVLKRNGQRSNKDDSSMSGSTSSVGVSDSGSLSSNEIFYKQPNINDSGERDSEDSRSSIDSDDSQALWLQSSRGD